MVHSLASYAHLKHYDLTDNEKDENPASDEGDKSPVRAVE